MAEEKGFDLKGTLENIFLAGVGAAAIVGEKASSIADDMVKKGKLTVEQGKSLNEELQKRAHQEVKKTTKEALRTQMEHMTPEERKELVQNVHKMADDIENEAARADSK